MIRCELFGNIFSAKWSLLWYLFPARHKNHFIVLPGFSYLDFRFLICFVWIDSNLFFVHLVLVVITGRNMLIFFITYLFS